MAAVISSIVYPHATKLSIAAFLIRWLVHEQPRHLRTHTQGDTHLHRQFRWCVVSSVPWDVLWCVVCRAVLCAVAFGYMGSSGHAPALAVSLVCGVWRAVGCAVVCGMLWCAVRCGVCLHAQQQVAPTCIGSFTGVWCVAGVP